MFKKKKKEKKQEEKSLLDRWMENDAVEENKELSVEVKTETHTRKTFKYNAFTLSDNTDYSFMRLSKKTIVGTEEIFFTRNSIELNDLIHLLLTVAGEKYEVKQDEIEIPFYYAGITTMSGHTSLYQSLDKKLVEKFIADENDCKIYTARLYTCQISISKDQLKKLLILANTEKCSTCNNGEK